MSSVREFLNSQYQNARSRLTQIRDTPHAIAGGVAIGLVCGFMPLFGFKTLLAVLIAWIFRCSKLSAAIAVAFHDILLPIQPLVWRWQFQVGYFILYHKLPAKVSFKHFHVENLFTWKTVHLLWPTLVGSIVLAIPVAIVAYFLVVEIVTRHQAAKARHSAPDNPPDVVDSD